MNPLLPLSIGAGLIIYALKQLSGQDESKSGETLTESKNRANLGTEVEKIETETKEETTENVDTVENDSNSDNRDGSGKSDS